MSFTCQRTGVFYSFPSFCLCFSFHSIFIIIPISAQEAHEAFKKAQDADPIYPPAWVGQVSMDFINTISVHFEACL